MDSHYESQYHDLEDAHFWFSGTRDLILRYLKDLPKTASILDIGCSGGRIIEELNINGFMQTSGIDKSSRAIEQCRSRSLKDVSVMNAEQLDFADNQFDAVIASSIIEHLEHDEQALNEWFRVLKPNGKLIVITSAYQFLWSDHDLVNHHFRRYSKKEFLSKVESSGFKVLHWTYWNSFLFPAVLVIRFLQNLFRKRNREPKSDFDHLPKWINSLLTQVLFLENSIAAKHTLPFGINILAIGKKE